MVIVRFKRSCPPYMPGETAGFDATRAAGYVSAGIADYEAPEPNVAVAVMPAPPATAVMASPRTKPGRRGR